LPNPPPPTFNVNRRTLLKAGVAGGAALVVARWLYSSVPPSLPQREPLAAAARTILSAIIPALLEGALPRGADFAAANQETLIAVEQTIAGLPPSTRGELSELFSLLDFAPTRCILAGVWLPWTEAPPETIAAFLARWRDSRLALLRSAYGALHQLVLAAWYANPRSWPATGYAGPPALSSE
jgi:hypothetical protein